MVDDEVWRLTIVDNGSGTLTVCGPEDAMREAFDAWRTGSWTGEKLHVSGYQDDVHRRPIEYVIRTDEVRSMYLDRA